MVGVAKRSSELVEKRTVVVAVVVGVVGAVVAPVAAPVPAPPEPPPKYKYRARGFCWPLT